MHPQHRRAADKLQLELIRQLGGCCANCGTRRLWTKQGPRGRRITVRNLEFNHIYQRTWEANRYNRYQRLLRYRKEMKQGLVNLLCRVCNKGYRPLPRMEAGEPF